MASYRIKAGETTLLIMKAEYKRPGLYILQEPNSCIKVASFINEEAVETFVDAVGRE